MFGIGMTELLVILVVALIVFGPNKLPELARSLGRAMHEFQRASKDLRASFNEAVDPTPQQQAATPAIPPAAPPAPLDQPAGAPPATTSTTAPAPAAEHAGPAPTSGPASTANG